ncbi:NADH-quinone oxidoreductase subunit K [Streptomyces radiopugnans]|uniref:Multicomponent Na+:H+ antiporter subunit C n=2 Tax=Streptomyces TaxID=1883 RepID=A0A1H9F5R3_9ACTN|nr:multicomponent Na+:H+ antiporter subunit C [Streptomyces radiopugnans]
MADPLPQAFVLTAIVITFGITVYLLGLARAEHLAGSGSRSGAGPGGPAESAEPPR